MIVTTVNISKDQRNARKRLIMNTEERNCMKGTLSIAGIITGKIGIMCIYYERNSSF